MNIETILRSQSLPITVSELIGASGLCRELVYAELVRMEGEGRARPIIGYTRHNRKGPGVSTARAGWIYLN